jgi:hypothetical protein
MAVRRVPEIVGKARNVDDIRVAAQRFAEFTSDLGNLEGVSQAGTWEISFARHHHLGLGCQSAQGRGMKDASAIASEIAAYGLLDRLMHEPGCIMLGIAPGHVMRLVRNLDSEAQRPE